MSTKNVINVKDSRRFYVEYELPNLCALCLTENPQIPWTIAQQERDTQTRFDLFRGIVTVKTDRNLDFNVKVCEDCCGALEKDQERRQKMSWIITGTGILLIVIGGLGLVYSLDKSPFIYGLLFLMLYLCWISRDFLIPFVVSLLLPKKPLATRSFDGKKFTFRNKRYQAAFAELNPKLVYRK